MAKSDQATIAWIREGFTTIGTTPATPVFGYARVLSDSLASQANVQEVLELTNTPGVAGESRGGFVTGGSLVMPMAYNDLIDDLFRAVLGSASGPWGDGTPITPDFQRYGYTLEKGYIDSAGTRRYHRWVGATFAACEIAFQPLQPLQITADAVGGSFSVDDAILTGATYVDPAPTAENAPQMRSAGVSWAYGGSLSVLDTLCHTSLSLRLDRQTTVRECIGEEDAAEFELGTLVPTITATVLYGGNEPQEAWISGEEFSLALTLLDDRVTPDQHSYVFTLPRCKISQAPVTTPAKGSDVVTQLELMSLQPTGGDAVSIAKDTA